MDFVDGLKSTAGKAEVGDMTFVSRMLATQAVALGTIFGGVHPAADLSRRRVPVTGGERSKAVPDARRHKPWRA